MSGYLSLRDDDKDGRNYLQTRSHLRNQRIHQVRVPNAHIGQRIHDIVLDGNLCAGCVQQATECRNDLFGHVFVLVATNTKTKVVVSAFKLTDSCMSRSTHLQTHLGEGNDGHCLEARCRGERARWWLTSLGLAARDFRGGIIVVFVFGVMLLALRKKKQKKTRVIDLQQVSFDIRFPLESCLQGNTATALQWQKDTICAHLLEDDALHEQEQPIVDLCGTYLS